MLMYNQIQVISFFGLTTGFCTGLYLTYAHAYTPTYPLLIPRMASFKDGSVYS